jgi:hypothetical protein
VGSQVREKGVWEGTRSVSAPYAGEERLHDRDHAQSGEPALEIGRAGGAVLDPVPEPERRRAGRLDRVTHRFDRRVADRVSGHLEPGPGGPVDQVAQLFGRGAPAVPPAAYGG